MDVLSGADFADNEGGFSAAASLLGTNPALYHLDTSRPHKIYARTLTEEISLTLQARALNANWTNTNVVNLQGTALLNIGAGNTFTNASGATFTLSSTNANPLGGAGTFNNAGTLDKSAAGTQAFGVATFSNAGTVNVNSGTLQVTTGGTDSGTYNVATGTALNFASGTRNLNTGSNIAGLGAFAVSGGTTNVRGSLGITATGTVSTSPVAVASSRQSPTWSANASVCSFDSMMRPSSSRTG